MISKKWIITIICVFVFCIGVITFGYMYVLKTKNNQLEENNKKITRLTEESDKYKEEYETILAIQSSSRNEKKVSPNAIFTLERFYQNCR